MLDVDNFRKMVFWAGFSEQEYLRTTVWFGFTLIELLVVVLIICILAAVALPQYGKAVWKTHSAPLLMWTQKLFESQEVCFLYNGKYTLCLNDLDLGYENAFPTEIEKNGSCVTNEFLN